MRIRASGAAAMVAAMLAALAAAGEEPAPPPKLPEGDTGIASKYPGDAGIGKDPAVVFSDNFESGTVEEIWRRWWKDQPMEEKHAKAQALSDETPPVGSGRRSIQMTGTLGENSGSHLFTVLPERLEKAYLRFYTRFAPDHGYEHHFVALSGYAKPDPWPFPKAGVRPNGDDRFHVMIDPVGWYGKFEPPGVWNLYTYWCEMKASADGKYWGNCIQPPKDARVPRGKWICVELMVKMNDPAKRDGELALWIDGGNVLHVREGVRRGGWSGMGFPVVESGGEPFEGLRLRTTAELKITSLWLEHYVDEGAQKQNKVAEPNKVNRVWFDDVVVAKEYIGPLAKPKAEK